MTKSSSGAARPWTIEDLYHRKAYLRAVPVLLLEKWEDQGGALDTVIMSTDEIQDELVSRGLLEKPFSSKYASCLVRSLQLKEKQRRLKPTIVVEQVNRGVWRFNVGPYKNLLRSFREEWPIRGKDAPAPALTEQPILAEENLNVQSQSFANNIFRVTQEYERLWQERLQDLENRAEELEQENRQLREETKNKRGPRKSDAVRSVLRQWAEARKNLRLIRERKSEYVMEVDIPMQLIKDQRRLQKQIEEIERQLEELTVL